MYDAIIIGSGPSGVAAAYTLKGKNILLLDVGNLPDRDINLCANFYDTKKNAESYFRGLIGDNFESLNNIDREYLMPKVKAPYQRYVVADANRFGTIRSETFNGFISYAQGGLANVWGAQLYRFNDEDLKMFPINASDLAPYYDKLTGLIGICGHDDDLTPFYGLAKNLLPPLELSSLGTDLLQKYSRRREFFREKGIYIGKPRLGVLSTDYLGRKKCDYSNLEFFKPQIPYIYTPSVTLNELIAKNLLDYKPKYLALRYKEMDNKIIVEARNIDTSQTDSFDAKKLILAAGTLGTAKIVLNSNEDFQTKLPMMENLPSYIPFLNFFKIGSSQEKRSFYTQLNLFYKGEMFDGLVMGTFYTLSGILHSDILFDMPFSVRSSIIASKYVIPAIMVLNLWYPAHIKEDNYVSLERSGDLHISYRDRVTGNVEKHLIKAFRRIGYFSLPSLCKYPLPGNSFHYAGTLPMKAKPSSRYETDPYGRLSGTSRIYVVDGSCFPFLPAKNLSFTIMANSMRIATHIESALDKGF